MMSQHILDRPSLWGVWLLDYNAMALTKVRFGVGDNRGTLISVTALIVPYTLVLSRSDRFM